MGHHLTLPNKDYPSSYGALFEVPHNIYSVIGPGFKSNPIKGHRKIYER